MCITLLINYPGNSVKLLLATPIIHTVLYHYYCCVLLTQLLIIYVANIDPEVKTWRQSWLVDKQSMDIENHA